jgi:hypothetical protein
VKRLLLAPVLLIGLSACTGPSTNASIPEFCDAMQLYWVSAESIDMADHIAAAEALRDSGTPSGAPRQAVDSVAALAAWVEGDPEDASYFHEMSREQRSDLIDLDRWGQLTCASGEIADLDDYPVPRP